MAKSVFKSPHDIQSRIGEEIAVTDWLPISQERINLFADATDDHQWIHVDAARAKNESPFKAPIAHGYLTLSLLAGFIDRSIQFERVTRVINYGLNKVRFPAPVLVGSQVRAKFVLKSFDKRSDGSSEVTWSASIEIKDQDRPACVAEMIFLYYSE